MHCKETAAQLRGRLPEIRQAGVELVFVGNGSVAHARRFGERHVPGCEVYTDPSRAAYRELGLKRGRLATLGPGSLLAGVRATARGHVQTSLEGDAWQQGGLFAVRSGGEIAFAQRNRGAGDRPDLDEAIAALAVNR